MYSDYESDYVALLQSAGLSTLDSMRKKEILTEIFKSQHGLCPEYIKSYFVPKQEHYNLRKKNQFVLQKKNTTKFGLKSFQYFGAKLWNQLPNDVKNIDSIEEFKHRISMLEL